MNMAMSLPGVSRFRVNIFQQRGSVGMVIRRIKADVLSLDEMGLPSIFSKTSSCRNAVWCWWSARPARASRRPWRR